MNYLILLFTLGFSMNSAIAIAQVDYTDDIQPIFNANCTSCHGGQNGVTLTSYAETMNSVGSQYGTMIVVAGDADGSPLVDKIEPNPQFGARMPQGGSLSSGQIALIRQWIDEGANEVATSNEVLTEIPKGYRLFENYPNPFNPSTNISFEVPESVTYKVNVYNPIGALVTELTGTASAGTISLRLNLESQPTGIYVYQVIAESGNERYLLGSSKMTLIK